MGATWFHSEEYVQTMGISVWWPVCVMRKQKTQNILLQGVLFQDFRGDALLTPLAGHLRYAFLFISLLAWFLRKMQQDGVVIILIAAQWPRWFWFPNLLQLSACPLINIQFLSDLLTQDGAKSDKLIQTPSTSWLGIWMGVQPKGGMFDSHSSYP